MKKRFAPTPVPLFCFILFLCILSPCGIAGAAVSPDTAIKKELEELFANPPEINGFPYQAELTNAARRYNLPLPFVTAVARGESFFRPDARSSRGAVGIMQVMPETAADYGVSAHDLRDPNKNIDVGVHYLADLYDRLHDPYLTLAAYYCGCGGVDKKQLEVRKDCDDYVRYIHTHLRSIMATSGKTPPAEKASEKFFVLTVFDNFLDAENFLKFMNEKLPGIKLDTFRTEAIREDHARYQYQILAAYRHNRDKNSICQEVHHTTGFRFCDPEFQHTLPQGEKGKSS